MKEMNRSLKQRPILQLNYSVAPGNRKLAYITNVKWEKTEETNALYIKTTLKYYNHTAS